MTEEAREGTVRLIAIIGVLLALTGCAARVSGHPVAGIPSPSTDTASASADTTVKTATGAEFTVTSSYPQCAQDTQAYLAYLETGQPPSLDLQYGSNREHVQYLTGDTRRIELTQFADAHVRACEKQLDDAAAAEQAAAQAAVQQEVRQRERAFCDKVGGHWMFGEDCDVTYTITPGPGQGGWAPWSQTYGVKFDANGDPTGDRADCPDRAWHADTRICTAA